MASLASGLDIAVQVAFVLLALAILADWLRHRDTQRIFLVLAMITLSALVLLGPLARLVQLAPRLQTDLGVVVFLLSGYFLLLFRDSLVPLGRTPKIVVTVAVALVALIDIAADLPSAAGAARTDFQVFAVIALIVTWVGCVSEPMFRFAVASIGRPAAEGARLRALSLGYIGLVAVIVVSSFLGKAAQSANVKVVSDIVGLLVVPMLYASFSPPAWLRRIWSYPEQAAIREALHDLLLFSPDRETLAGKALDSALRLVGGASAYIRDSDGTILAARGMTPEAALRMPAGDQASQTTISIPLDLEGGTGTLVMIAGPFTPVFGQDEVSLLRAYSVSVTAGLNRVSLTERIAALEKAKGEFLNLASHELRAPMTVIKGYLTMMAAGTLGAMPEKFSGVLPMLVAKSDEVTSMLEQMIEASRLEDGRMALKRQRVDITLLTQDAIDAFEPILGGNHTIKYDRPSTAVWGNVDPDRYQIVVRNLLSNAIKYSPAGTNVDVRLRPDTSVALLSVTDEGIGIADEDRARLFTRFGRIENSATMHTAGTGLGLWLSREIARMHDGDLKVDSEVGKGSTFTLEIPIDSDSAPRARTPVSVQN